MRSMRGTELVSQSRHDLRAVVHAPTGEVPAEGWPVLLFLHGSGERGDDLSRVCAWGPPAMVERGEAVPFLVVSPLCAAGRAWEVSPLLALLDAVGARYAVDARGVCVTGISMGGYGAAGVAAMAPERFAACVPVCGGYPGPLLHAEALASVPVWAFHGGADEVVDPGESVRLVDRVRAAGGEARLTIYDGVGHDCWTRAYAEPALWAWLRERRR